jgi:hypothetical protein
MVVASTMQACFLSFWMIFSSFTGITRTRSKPLKMYEKSLIDFYRCNELPSGKSSGL